MVNKAYKGSDVSSFNTNKGSKGSLADQTERDNNQENLDTYYSDKTDRDNKNVTSEKKKPKRFVKVEEIKENKKSQICNKNTI